MKIAFFVNRDIHANVALNHLKHVLQDHDVSLFFSDKVGHAPGHETLDILRLIEQDIPNEHVYPGVDEPGELLSFTELGRRFAMPLETVHQPNDPAFIERLGVLAPDLVISIRYGRIFKDAFIAVPGLGVLNLHSGLLPSYRGVLATLQALLAGDDEIGCTLHFILDATIDTGPIVDEARVPVDANGSLFGHVLSLYEPGARLVEKAIATLMAGEALDTRPKTPDAGNYFTFPTAEELVRFASLGYPVFKASEYRSLLARYRRAPLGLG
ncbi:MAG: formyl transferase [Acidobacteria bacterium]|nr:MAG: formyl transferase [Acidobacteriota bacterium]